MGLQSTELLIAISLMLLGCATNPSAPQSDNRLWDLQKQRQQQAARDAGRIGWIGKRGATLSMKVHL
jgi:starvation-inducible outer membrane lipoprotein